MYALRVGGTAGVKRARGSTPHSRVSEPSPRARAYYVSAAKFLSSASRVALRMNARLPFHRVPTRLRLPPPPSRPRFLPVNAFGRVRVAARSICTRRDYYSAKLSAIWKTRRGNEHSDRDKLLFVGGKARACTAGWSVCTIN